MADALLDDGELVMVNHFEHWMIRLIDNGKKWFLDDECIVNQHEYQALMGS